jgi:uncharacterized protein with HEPN domain
LEIVWHIIEENLPELLTVLKNKYPSW